MAPLLAEGLEPDRVSGTKAWRVGTVILHPRGCLHRVSHSAVLSGWYQDALILYMFY